MTDTSPNISTLASNIKKGVDERLKDLHTAIPGIIESFDPVTQLASVQPTIKRIFKTIEEDSEVLEAVAIPKLINVPVAFPRGGGFTITFPVKKGDECLLVICERSIDAWYKSGEVKEPVARRFHNYSDAIAYVGLSSEPNKIENFDSDNMVIKYDDSSAEIIIKTDGTIVVKSNTKITFDTPLAEFTGNVDIQGETSLTDVVTSNGKDISDTHTHVGSATAPTGGVSNTGVPT